MAGQILTAERLRQLLHYDPLTGVFVRLVRTTNRVKVGDIAGGSDSSCYVQISVDGKKYLGHRLACLYMTGSWPSNQMDHENTNNSDNRWENIRPATQAQNNQNKRRAQSNNKCGLLGVCAHRSKWRATISINRIRYHIGTFDTPELAHKAYLQAKAKMHPFQTIIADDSK